MLYEQWKEESQTSFFIVISDYNYLKYTYHIYCT